MTNDQRTYISEQLFSETLEKAREGNRGRINYNFHKDYSESPNRFLNVMLKGTYFTPHRHLFPPKPESFLILKGSVIFFIFNDDGTIVEATRLEPGKVWGIDLQPGVWHTLLVMSDHAICYEVKPGPYAPANDKEFAPWAPREGAEGCSEYLSSLEQWVLENAV